MKTWYAGTLLVLGMLGIFLTGCGLIGSALWGEFFFHSFITPDKGVALVHLNFYLALALITSTISMFGGCIWLLILQSEPERVRALKDTIEINKRRYLVSSS